MDEERLRPHEIEQAIAADLWRHGPSSRWDIASRLGLPGNILTPRRMMSMGHLVEGFGDSWWLRDVPLSRQAGNRPMGPFGPACRLLPKSQNLYMVDGLEPIRPTLERMVRDQYSAVPVTRDGQVVGVVTTASIHEHLLARASEGVSLEQILNDPVEKACREVQFVGPLDYIDEGIDWLMVEHVLVGSPSDPLGLLTISDVWRYLDGFAHAFVLLHEIETGLRQFITIVLEHSGVDLGGALAELPALFNRPTPTSLEQLTFRENLLLMRLDSVQAHFEPHLATLGDFEGRFHEVNDFRNRIAHFRVELAPVVPGDERPQLEPLRRFRTWVESRLADVGASRSAWRPRRSR